MAEKGRSLGIGGRVNVPSEKISLAGVDGRVSVGSMGLAQT